MLKKTGALALVVLAAVIFAATSGASRPSSDSADLEAIQQLQANYAEVVNVEPIDLKVAAQIWLDSPEVSFLHPLGTAYGWQQIKQDFYQNIMEGYFSERKLTFRDVHVHLKGDCAWAELKWHFVAKSRKNGATQETDGRETQIYQKTGPGRWVFVHVHYSPPPMSMPRG